MTSRTRPPVPPSIWVLPGPRYVNDLRSLQRVCVMLASLAASGAFLLMFTEPATTWAIVMGYGCLGAGALGVLAVYVRLERRLRRTSPPEDVVGRAQRRFLVTYVPVGLLGSVLLAWRETAPPWVVVAGFSCLVVVALGCVVLMLRTFRRTGPGSST